MNDQKLGEKIKKFRKRAGMSQLDLEVNINASPGSISRIENGKVNPDKETLSLIARALDLKSYDVAYLFNMNEEDYINKMKLSQRIMSSLNLNEVLQNSVNEISYELDLLGAVLDLIDGERLFAQTFTQSWYTQLASKVMGIPFNKLSVKIIDAQDNLMVKAIQNKKVYYCNHIFEIGVPFLNKTTCNLLERISTAKSGIIFPIISNKGVSLGAIYFAKNVQDDFSGEYKILEIFCENLGVAIENATKYERLKIELTNYKNSN